VRVTPGGPDASRVHARNHSFDVGRQASFRDSDPCPSAIELVLGALGGDLVSGWRAEAGRQGIALEEIELTLGCRLDDPLRHLGVVGATGHAGIAAIEGTIYVTADAHAPDLEAAWREVRERSPLFTTLSRCVSVRLDLHVVH
jgi:hypothetical protein